jgi:IclR family acetate operon transcriptional repressor
MSPVASTDARSSATTQQHDVPRGVGRAFELLEAVVGAGELTLSAAAEVAGLTPTTALRHLRALEALGYVRRDTDGVYGAGPAVWQLAARARGAGPLAHLVAAAEPILDELTAATGESSYLAVTEGADALYLATSESTRSIRHVGWVGRTVPLAGTAVGAALAGAEGAQFRTSTIEPDIAAVAHAVTLGGSTVAALSVIGPVHRVDDATAAAIGDAIGRAVRRLEATIGRSSSATGATV